MLHCGEERFSDARHVFERAIEAATARLAVLSTRSPASVDSSKGERKPADGLESESQARADMATAESNIAQLFLHFGDQLGIADDDERLRRAATAFERAAENAGSPDARQMQLERLAEVRIQQEEAAAKSSSMERKDSTQTEALELSTSDIPAISPAPASNSEASDSSCLTQRIEGSRASIEPPEPEQPSPTDEELEREVLRLMQEHLDVAREIRQQLIDAEQRA